jgi:tetratricopeptide (TPR) repeat protein
VARPHPLSVAGLVALVGLVGLGGPAFAQSKRYPAPPEDADLERDRHSSLWESALDPQRKPYDELVRDAKRMLDDRTKSSASAALAKLDDAVARLPADHRAHVARGLAYLLLADWAKCAADLELANVPALDPHERDAVELELGICQARAGAYAEAERTLLHAVTLAPHGEQWMRLGEVRIALGKLDEAVDALSAALEARDGSEGTIHWLLALAYDRARKATAAEEEARRAIQFDTSFNTLVNPTYPWLRAGEDQYMLGIAYATMPMLDREQARPELALLYFRHFLATAATSPWRRRASEHVKALAAMAFPQTLTRSPQSTSLVDTARLVPIVQKAMPPLRACLAKQPGLSFAVSIIKAGPRTPESVTDRPRYNLPASAIKVTLDHDLDAAMQPVHDAARTCIEAGAAKIALPWPKDRDTYYQLSFFVVAP